MANYFSMCCDVDVYYHQKLYEVSTIADIFKDGEVSIDDIIDRDSDPTFETYFTCADCGKKLSFKEIKKII